MVHVVLHPGEARLVDVWYQKKKTIVCAIIFCSSTSVVTRTNDVTYFINS